MELWDSQKMLNLWKGMGVCTWESLASHALSNLKRAALMLFYPALSMGLWVLSPVSIGLQQIQKHFLGKFETLLWLALGLLLQP